MSHSRGMGLLSLEEQTGHGPDVDSVQIDNFASILVGYFRNTCRFLYSICWYKTLKPCVQNPTNANSSS